MTRVRVKNKSKCANIKPPLKKEAVMPRDAQSTVNVCKASTWNPKKINEGDLTPKQLYELAALDMSNLKIK